MRHISFALTTAQIRARTKTETRRLGWIHARRGDQLQAVVKSQGLKKGEHPEKLCVIEIVDVWREPLNEIDKTGCEREGFPEMTPAQFVGFFCHANGCRPDRAVTVISFVYIEHAEDGPFV